MNQFIRFPSTPYLVDLGHGEVRRDKILSPEQREHLLSQRVVIEEKVDGQNLGISRQDSDLMFQSRGSYVELGGRHFRGLESWIRPRRDLLMETLGDELVIFGEWCAVSHSVFYDRLPDWFVVFDVFNRTEGGFLSLSSRDQIAATLNLHVTPTLYDGFTNLPKIFDLIGRSNFGSDPMEGVVVRPAVDDGHFFRAKVVRPDFVQSIDQHWMSGPQKRNRLLSVS